MLRIALLSAVLVSAVGCKGLHGLHLTFGGIQGSGKAKTESRTVGNFQKIDFKGSFDIVWTRGDKQSITVKTDDNLQKHLLTESKNGVLDIRFDKNCSSNVETVVTIVSPTLKGFELNGSGDAKLTDVATNDFALELTGSGDITVSGAVSSCEMALTGSGNIDAQALNIDDAQVNLVGSGDIECRTKNSLQISLLGSGDISYFGNPKVEQNVTGSGSVSKKS